METQIVLTIRASHKLTLSKTTKTNMEATTTLVVMVCNKIITKVDMVPAIEVEEIPPAEDPLSKTKQISQVGNPNSHLQLSS